MKLAKILQDVVVVLLLCSHFWHPVCMYMVCVWYVEWCVYVCVYAWCVACVLACMSMCVLYLHAGTVQYEGPGGHGPLLFQREKIFSVQDVYL